MYFKINTIEIRKKEINNIKTQISQIIDNTLNDYNKTILLLKSNKTTVIIIKNNKSMNITINNDNINISFFNPLYLQDSNSSLTNTYDSLSDSTRFDSKLNINNNNSINENITELKFNQVRSNYYLKYNLYDVPIGQLISKYNHPPKYKINDELYSFVYPNELITYCFTISGFLSNKNKISFNFNLINLENNELSSKFDSILGLYFCGQILKFQLENEISIKKCVPNEFMCKECMRINKKAYNIKDNYLININGRVAKINKDKYHCFGKFLCGNKIEDCIKNFSCRACTILDKYSKYYLNKVINGILNQMI